MINQRTVTVFRGSVKLVRDRRFGNRLERNSMWCISGILLHSFNQFHATRQFQPMATFSSWFLLRANINNSFSILPISLVWNLISKSFSFVWCLPYRQRFSIYETLEINSFPLLCFIPKLEQVNRIVGNKHHKFLLKISRD